MNSNPAMSLDNSVLEKLLPEVIDGTLELVLRAQGIFPTATEGLPGNFRLLLDEKNDFVFSI